MNNEEPIRDQAEKLRKKIKTIQNTPEQVIGELSNEKLPPRSRVHKQTQKKTKVKVKYPVLRILGLFFVLLPIVVFSVYTYNHSSQTPVSSEAESESGGYETVSIPEEFEDTISTTAPSIEDQNNPNDDNKNVEAAGEDTAETKVETTTPIKEEQKSSSVSTTTTKESQPAVAKKTQPATPTPEVRYHVVQRGETLYRVAMKYFKSQRGIAIIREANHLNGNEIKVGQKLTIPLNK